MTATLSDRNCSCAKTGTKVWCWMKKITDPWREMMHEKIISEVKQIKIKCSVKALNYSYDSYAT